jgi:hypothetical protein
MPFFGVPIRNGLPIGLGSSAGFGVQPFDPSYLFAAGEQGAWYDPSDFSTLFDSSAGTTPVTAVEQFVGLMLDKSKGLVLGSELATGILGSTSGWTFVGAANVTGGAIVFNTPPSTNASAQYNPIVASGKWYQSTITITGTGQVIVQLGSAGTTVTLVAPGTYTFRGLASGGTPTVLTFSSVLSSVNNFVGSVTAVSVRELPGNHAFQTTSAKRPKLAKRYNLLDYTEEFDNGAWTRSATTVAANSTTAPDGSSTADTLTAAATGNLRILRRQNAGLVANTAFRYAVYIKKNTSDWVALRFWDLGAGTAAWFNINTGVTGTVQTGCTASITDAGNGWYRCSITRTMAGSIAYNECDIMVSSADNSDTATIGDSVFVWGADLRPASQATGLIGPTYQRVAAATVYDTAGFLPYLAFDGLDDSMSTNSIDPGAIDKAQVFAGVRKLSDSFAIIAELSASVSSNNGVFGLWPPGFSGNFAFYSKGTSAAEPVRSLAAPVTAVLAGIGDISGDFAAIRVNGLQTTSSADQGTGNFGNYPLFIGARNNAGSFFQGWLSSMIVRFGANLSQSQIDSTESWVNQKTGAF